MNNKLPAENSNGITIKELRDFLEKFPDDGEVWIETAHGISNQVHIVWELGNNSVILESYSIK